MWEKELKLIDSLGKLYPILKYSVKYKECQININGKVWWVFFLCVDYVKQRIPCLEEFVKKHDNRAWVYYKQYFKIVDEQCGKKS